MCCRLVVSRTPCNGRRREVAVHGPDREDRRARHSQGRTAGGHGRGLRLTVLSLCNSGSSMIGTVKFWTVMPRPKVSVPETGM